tara:strand:+ start:562 stop:1362 length:801 start_codon:yes stop_codon:yes gene_type:complete
LIENIINQSIDMQQFSLSDLQHLFQVISPHTRQKHVIISFNQMRLGLPNYNYSHIYESINDILYLSSFAIPSYSRLPFSDRQFHRYTTPVENYLGGLSKFVFLTNQSYRLLSSTHSFIVSNQSPLSLDKVYLSSYGDDSSFSDLLSNDFYWLNIGCDLFETCTFMHHVEWLNSDLIDYRHDISVPVTVIADPQSMDSIDIKFTIFARKNSLFDYDWRPVSKALSDHNLLANADFPFPVSLISLSDILLHGTQCLRNKPSQLLRALT